MNKFSFIVIMKDTRNYLEKCLDSIVNQSFQDFETIIVDDNSNTKSNDIVDRYRKHTDRISYYYLDKSIGPGGARNTGLKLASGEYVMFLDSDDWVDINLLEKVNIIIEKHHPDIAMFNLMRNYDIPTEKPYYKCCYESVQIIKGITAFQMMSGKYLLGPIISPSALNKFYKKEYLKMNNISFLEKVYYEDVPFAFQTLLADGTVVTVPDVNYHNYKRSGSIIQSITKRHFDDMKLVFLQIKKYLIDHNNYDAYKYDYYKIFERFYNLLLRQVFNYAKSEDEKKKWILYSLNLLKEIIVLDEYMEIFSAEEIRRHLQPYVIDLTLY